MRSEKIDMYGQFEKNKYTHITINQKRPDPNNIGQVSSESYITQPAPAVIDNCIISFIKPISIESISRKIFRGKTDLSVKYVKLKASCNSRSKVYTKIYDKLNPSCYCLILKAFDLNKDYKKFIPTVKDDPSNDPRCFIQVSTYPAKAKSYTGYIKFLEDFIPKSILDDSNQSYINSISIGKNLYGEEIEETLRQTYCPYIRNQYAFPRWGNKIKGGSFSSIYLGYGTFIYDKLNEANLRHELTLSGRKLLSEELNQLAPITRIDHRLSYHQLADYYGLKNKKFTIYDLPSLIKLGQDSPLLYPFVKNIQRVNPILKTKENILKIKNSHGNLLSKSDLYDLCKKCSEIEMLMNTNGITFMKKRLGDCWSDQYCKLIDISPHSEPYDYLIEKDLKTWLDGKNLT